MYNEFDFVVFFGYNKSYSINIHNKLYYLIVVPNCEKENAPEGPTQKGLREAREQSKCKIKMKANTKV